MLRDLERASARTHDGVLGGRGGSGYGHVFKFEGHHVDAARKGADLVQIVVGRLEFDVGDLPRRRVAFRRERVHAVPQTPRGDREHAPELSAAEHADCRSRKDGARRHVSESRRTAAAIS